MGVCVVYGSVWVYGSVCGECVCGVWECVRGCECVGVRVCVRNCNYNDNEWGCVVCVGVGIKIIIIVIIKF